MAPRSRQDFKARSCRLKVPFKSKAGAETEAVRLNASRALSYTPVVAYHCQFGAHWHIGHKGVNA